MTSRKMPPEKCLSGKRKIELEEMIGGGLESCFE